MKGRPLRRVPIRQYQVVLNAAWLRSCRSCILYVLHRAGRKNTDVVVADLNADLTKFNQSDHPLPFGSIKVRAGVAVVNEKLDVFEFLFVCKSAEDGFLIRDGVTLVGQLILAAESAIDSCSFFRLPHVSVLLHGRAVCQYRIACIHCNTHGLLCHSSCGLFTGVSEDMWASSLEERLRCPS